MRRVLDGMRRMSDKCMIMLRALVRDVNDIKTRANAKTSGGGGEGGTDLVTRRFGHEGMRWSDV